MIRKFECKDCGDLFDADDSKEVVCPQCKSDNVDYFKKRKQYKKPLLVIVTLIVACGVAALTITWLRSNASDKTTKEASADSTSTELQDSVTVEMVENEYEQETGLQIPPSIKIEGDKTLDKDQKYNFTVAVDHKPARNFKIVIREKKSNKVVAESTDGKFNGVPASKEDGGIYIMQLVDSKTGENLSEPQTMDGFIPMQKVSHKLTLQEFQALLDKEDDTLIGDGENPYLSAVYTIKYKGLDNDDNAPTTLADVIEKLYMGVWKSVKVDALDYDNSMHISTITLSVKK